MIDRTHNGHHYSIDHEGALWRWNNAPVPPYHICQQWKQEAWDAFAADVTARLKTQREERRAKR